MKLIVSEFTSGFSDYSSALCKNINCDGRVDKLIILTPTDNKYFEKLPQEIDKRKVYKVYNSGKRYKRGGVIWGIDRIYKSLYNCIKRNRIVRKEKPDILLLQASHSIFDWFFLMILPRNIYKVLTVHDVIVPTKSLSWSMKSLKKHYMYSDRLIVHSNTNRDQLKDFFGVPSEKITVIPHGINSNYNKLDKEYCKKRLKINCNKPVLLFYGGIRASKGLDLLIESLENINCHLLVVGNPSYGETFDKYQELINKKKIEATTIIEYTPDGFRDIVFQASDYLVLPYKEFYSQSGVFSNAIEYRLPVIATDVSSFREYIEKYDIGFIAQPNNIESLHQIIKVALQTSKDYSDNMEKAVQENCWKVASKQYVDAMLCGIK